jgi:hypothetical protein
MLLVGNSSPKAEVQPPPTSGRAYPGFYGQGLDLGAQRCESPTERDVNCTKIRHWLLAFLLNL